MKANSPLLNDMKHLAFIIVLISFVVEPISITINFLSDIDYEVVNVEIDEKEKQEDCLLYTSPSPRD